MVENLDHSGGTSGKESADQCRRCKFDLWVMKSPWRRKWQPTLISCLENSMKRGIPWREEPDGPDSLQFMGQQRVRHDSTHTPCLLRSGTCMSTLPTFIQHSFGSPSHGNQRRKRNKRNSNWVRSKIVIVCT